MVWMAGDADRVLTPDLAQDLVGALVGADVLLDVERDHMRGLLAIEPVLRDLGARNDEQAVVVEGALGLGADIGEIRAKPLQRVAPHGEVAAIENRTCAQQVLDEELRRRRERHVIQAKKDAADVILVVEAYSADMATGVGSARKRRSTRVYPPALLSVRPSAGPGPSCSGFSGSSVSVTLAGFDGLGRKPGFFGSSLPPVPAVANGSSFVELNEGLPAPRHFGIGESSSGRFSAMFVTLATPAARSDWVFYLAAMGHP